MCNNNSAFTLLEISIALVIIGLLAGSTLTGKYLIDVAKFGKEWSQLGKFQTAYNTFRIKYNAIPGDMRDATTKLPGVTAGHNGNGNGKIELEYYDFGPTLVWQEFYFVWEHLSKAGLIENSYDGIDTFDLGMNEQCVPTGCPSSIIAPGGSWIFGFLRGKKGWVIEEFQGNERYGFLVQGSHDWQYGPYSPQQAMRMDIKYDDGNPESGQIVASNDYIGGGCLTGGGPVDAYKVRDGEVYSRDTTAKDGCLLIVEMKMF